ncbi:MAG TPA: hypothetical protein ENN73_02850 [Firmicutes bacterium]|nr:hypothetical protein [Bacillota bacterium]
MKINPLDMEMSQFNNYTFYTDPCGIIGLCNFDSYSSDGPMSEYQNPSINEGFMKWSSAGGDLFTLVTEDNGQFELKVIEDSTIGGFLKGLQHSEPLIIKDKSFTVLIISAEDKNSYNSFSIKPLITAPNLDSDMTMKPIGEFREFNADGKAVKLNGEAVIKIRYSKQELGGDSPDSLVLCRFNGSSWVKVFSESEHGISGLNGGIITAKVNKLGIYGIFKKTSQKKASASPINIRVFPNPIKKAANDSNGMVIIDSINLFADKTELFLYSVAGELVADNTDDGAIKIYTGIIPTAGQSYCWNLKNNSGKDVAAGVYILLVKVDGVTQIKKIAVIK